jgi:hypothetical protein
MEDVIRFEMGSAVHGYTALLFGRALMPSEVQTTDPAGEQ